MWKDFKRYQILVLEHRGDVFTGPGVCEEAKTSQCTEAYSGLRMMSHVNTVAVVVHQITNEKTFNIHQCKKKKHLKCHRM